MTQTAPTIEQKKQILQAIAEGLLTPNDLKKIGTKSGAYDGMPESGFVIAPDKIKFQNYFFETSGDIVHFTNEYKNRDTQEVVSYKEFLNIDGITEGWFFVETAADGVTHINYINSFGMDAEKLLRIAQCNKNQKPIT